MNLIIDKTKKLGIPDENTTREIILWIRAKYEIEIWDGENSLPSTEINSNVQIRNMQTRSTCSIENRHYSNSK